MQARTDGKQDRIAVDLGRLSIARPQERAYHVRCYAKISRDRAMKQCTSNCAHSTEAKLCLS